ncbi:2-C-methyl-D-erythritol 4-phosphate cytidylyltransferase [Sinanaerobacter sp. ZZT-01]|uniref:2-C-methyl-D-erythritol 4-phosphate cytidylyltransferase n=1 Tax=Sinanaerobacter sp. ZZT-01 TaxID=3111540 RepID=UPI002D76FEC7|nr:2-C-methyl-D-erythritol 4-phosphate cytidylyltransferase [Sinanaerobacter sp. ZZT-01]WRR95017.1 2-C-methyl-D-erythritol 4-phosphate cytidylyltransferase [Sinanaerobacter sp. ZZT-01]
MYKNKKVAVIIAAAGSGTRMGCGQSKQFRKISGLPVVVRAVGVFSEHSFIDEIYIVARREEQQTLSQMIDEYGLKKIKAIVAGGETRQDSVFNGIKALEPDNEFVLVHDGARAFVSRDVITRTVEALSHGVAAAAAVTVKDTIKMSEDGVFTKTPDRSCLYHVQTPQGFHVSVLKEAHEKASLDHFYGTDDTVLVERIGKKVYLVEGDYDNIKITTEEDLLFGEAIVKKGREGGFLLKEECKQNIIRVGTGFDVHRLVEQRKLILGGVEIPFEKGLLGHSDADVLLHAIMDALLGAGGFGDIGTHFPDSDPAYCGISSLELLKQVDHILKEEGYTIGNIDASVIAQKPKIAPYIQEIRQKIAVTLQMKLNCINIKGTTTEQLGFCGREEGIAAQASVTLYQ